jgi:hypothetical protein
MGAQAADLPDRTSTTLMRRAVSDLTRPEGTMLVMTEASRGLADRTGAMSARLDAGETVPFDEALELERTATQAVLSDLLCRAHASADPLVFFEAQMRAETIAGMLDRIGSASRHRDAGRLNLLREEIEMALAACVELVQRQV